MSDRLITRYEWQRLVNLKPFIHYTKEEKEFFVRLAKEFVDPNMPDCGTCGGGGNAKTLVYGWFNDRKDELLRLIEDQELQDKIEKEVKDYTDGDETE